ncbi:UNVERIFIED_CONTAM: Peptidyl-prolyl cis-trans isomerase E [Sesamum indicum]
MKEGVQKNKLYVGGLAEEVNEYILHAAFIPFGDIKDKHRSFGFVTFLEREDAAAAMDNMDGAELYGRRIKRRRNKAGPPNLVSVYFNPFLVNICIGNFKAYMIDHWLLGRLRSCPGLWFSCYPFPFEHSAMCIMIGLLIWKNFLVSRRCGRSLLRFLTFPNDNFHASEYYSTYGVIADVTGFCDCVCMLEGAMSGGLNFTEIRQMVLSAPFTALFWADADTWFKRQQQEQEMQQLQAEQREAMQAAEDLHRKKMAEEREGKKGGHVKDEPMAKAEAVVLKQNAGA